MTTEKQMKSSKQTAKRRVEYPMGSVSCGTMREEDLIPEFCYQLKSLAKQTGIVPAKTRKEHLKMVREIEERVKNDDYFKSEDAGFDLNESLFDALDEYAAPYFYFGAHPGDGADYGFWLSEDWDEGFYTVSKSTTIPRDQETGIKVNDLVLVPSWFRGEVAVVNDHGNVTLYVKTSRSLREIWNVV